MFYNNIVFGNLEIMKARRKKITVKHVQKPNSNEQLLHNNYLLSYPNLKLPVLYLRLRYDNIQADLKSFYVEFVASMLPKEKVEMLHFEGSSDIGKFEIENILVDEQMQKMALNQELEAVRNIISFYLDKGINIINNKPSKYIEYNIYKLEHIIDNLLFQKLLVKLNKKSNSIFLPLLFGRSSIKFAEIFRFLKYTSTSTGVETDFYKEILQPYECFYKFVTCGDEISQMRVFEWKEITDTSHINKKLSYNYGSFDSQRIIEEIKYAIEENDEILKT